MEGWNTPEALRSNSAGNKRVQQEPRQCTLLREVPRKFRKEFLEAVKASYAHRGQYSYGNRGGSTGSCGVVELSGLEWLASPSRYQLCFPINRPLSRDGRQAPIEYTVSAKAKQIIATCVVRRIIRFAYNKFLYYDNPPTLTYFSHWEAPYTKWQVIKDAGFHVRKIGKSTHGRYHLAMAIWIPPDKSPYKRDKEFKPKG